VAGLGVDDRRDDGAGLEAARYLARLSPAGADVLVLSGRTADLLDAWAGAPLAVVLDAVRSGAAPGTLHRLDGLSLPLPDLPRRGSTHDLGLAATVELGRALGLLPERLVILGIEAEDVSPGRGLSPAVHRGVRRAVHEALAELGAARHRPVRDRRHPTGEPGRA